MGPKAYDLTVHKKYKMVMPAKKNKNKFFIIWQKQKIGSKTQNIPNKDHLEILRHKGNK